MKINIFNTVDICTYLNYIIDGLSNISYERIINLSVYIQIRTFQFESEEISTIKYLALKLVK